MWRLSTDTDSLSDSAATSLTSATVWALVSGPSSEAKTVSLTGPPIRSNSTLNARSSWAERNPMAAIISRLHRPGDRLPTRGHGEAGSSGSSPQEPQDTDEDVHERKQGPANQPVHRTTRQERRGQTPASGYTRRRRGARRSAPAPAPPAPRRAPT